MNYGYQDVILEEFQCHGHKSHHKVKSWKRGKMFKIKNEGVYPILGELTNLDFNFCSDRMVQLRVMTN